MDGEKAIEALRARFPEAVLSVGEFRGQHWATLREEALVDACRWLRDDPAGAFDVLLDVTAAHWPDAPEPIELIYHLYSTARNDRLRIKVRTADGREVPTLSGIFHSAEWTERETYDMFGVVFRGHPDLRRILMPEDYTDFPLRKEFPLYRG